VCRLRLSAPEPAAALGLVVAVHGLAPGLVAHDPDEVDEEEDAGEDRGAPREGEEDGEEAAGRVVPAPAEVRPVAVRDGGAGEEEDREEGEADEGVQEGVEERGVVPVVDRAQAGRVLVGGGGRGRWDEHVGHPEEREDRDGEELGDDGV
jgi:hypothetical protein